MTTQRSLSPSWASLIPGLLALASCSSPPTLPTVEEAQKRPVNTQTAVELQLCQNELHNTRLRVTDSRRTEELLSATLASIAAQRQALAALQPPRHPPAQDQANRIFTVHFAFGSTRADISPDLAAPLLEQARGAPLILLRGRTDGTSDTQAEGRIARDRAAAVRMFLVAAGVDATRIRSTYQPAGDQIAENHSAEGRSLNRRVEIELYRALPVAASTAVAQP